MNTWLVARKTLIELLREPKLLLVILALPVAMLLVTYLGYGATLKLATRPVLVLDPEGAGASISASLAAKTYFDGRPMFRLMPVADQAAADAALMDHTADVLLRISKGADNSPQFVLKGDATSMAFTIASTYLSEALQPDLDKLSGRPLRVSWAITPLSLRTPQTDFEIYMPGMIIFGILFLIPQTAMLVGREMRGGMLRRLQLTRLAPAAFLAGVGLAQMGVAVVECLLVIAAAALLGFHNAGSLPLAVAVGLLLSLSAVGMGLLTACFIHDDSQALNLGSTVTMLQVFLSGAFFAMPPYTLFNVAGYSISPFDFIPATHAMVALQEVLISGAGLAEIAFRVSAMAVLTLLYTAACIVLFQILQRPAKA